MTTRIQLLDRCMVLNGSEPLGSEAAPGAETHLAVYDSVVENVLSCHPWRCCTFIRELNRKEAPPGVHWKYSYEFPAEMHGAPRAVYDSAECRIAFTRYELFGDNELRTDAARIWLRFTKLVEPRFWPGHLRAVMELLMRSDLALSVREDRVLRDKLREDALGPPSMMGQGGQMAIAKGADDLASPSPILAEGEDPLIDVRR